VKADRLTDRNDKKRIIDIILTVLFIIFSAYILFVINESMSQNSNLENARDFHIRMSYNFNNSYLHGRESPADIEIDLKMHYLRGTLIVDDPVEVAAIATLNSLNAQNVRSLSIGFQSAQAWPQTQSDKGITKEASLIMDRIRDEREITGKTNLTWTLECTYSTSLALNFKDGTSQETTWGKDWTITVYPKSQFAQIVANKAILLLAIPAFLLAFIKIFSIIRFFLVTILIRENSEVDNSHTKAKNNARAINDKPNETDKWINGENPNKTSRPDCDKGQKD
jgi:hypothetical protein